MAVIQGSSTGGGPSPRRRPVNSAWRRQTEGAVTGSLVLKAIESLKPRSPRGDFLRLVAQERSIVEPYVRDYFLLREKFTSSLEEAQRMAETFYTVAMIPQLERALPKWDPRKRRYHDALAEWISEAFFAHHRRKVAPAPQTLGRAIGKGLLNQALGQLSDSHRAVLTDPQLDKTAGTVRVHLHRARNQLAQFLLEAVRDRVRCGGGDESPDSLRDAFEEYDLMQHLSERFQRQHLGVRTEA